MNEQKDIKKDNMGTVYTLAAGHACIDSYSAFINPIMPFIAQQLGITLAVASAVMSVAHLCSSIIQPLFGYAADLLKRRFFIFWGLIIASAFLSLTGVASNPLVLTIFLALGSMGVAFYHPQATGFVKQFSFQNATKNMGIFLAGGTIGFSIGPLVSSFVVGHFGLSSMPMLMLYGFVVAALVLKLVPKSDRVALEDEPKSKVSFNKFFSEFLTAVKESFKNNNFRILFAVAVAKCLTVSSCCMFLPFLWQKMAYPVEKIGVLIFLFVSAGALGTIMSGMFERRVGAVKVFYLSLLTTFPLMIIFALTYASLPVISYFAIVAVGFFALIAIPINMVMAQNALPQYKGLVSGFIGGFSWGIVGIMLPFIGFIAQHIGIPTLLIMLSLVPLGTALFVKKLKY